MLTGAVLITWLAAGYRVTISASQPRTLWRFSFTAVMVTVAVALSLYDFRTPIDRFLDVPDLGDLLSRVVITVGVGFLFVYLHALRVEDVPMTALGSYALITAAVLLTLLTSWDMGSFGGREVDDLLQSPSASAVVYCLAFWSFLGMALALTAETCLHRWRTVRHADPGREVSLLLTASGAIVGLAVLNLWSASMVLAVSGADGTVLNAWGDRLLPTAAGLGAGGVISLLVVPYLAALWVTGRRWWVLRPLWMELVARYPQVHLDVRLSGGPLTRLQFFVERMIIETLDALRIAPAGPLPAGAGGVEAVARSLIADPICRSGVHAAELLDHSDTRDAEVDQLIMLAAAFERMQHVAA